MTATQWPTSLRPLVAELWADIQKSSNDREAAKAKADPIAHKLSRVIEGGTGYTYYSAGKDGRGRKVRFCWSSHRNVAGYFLGWREVESKKQTKRDMWAARKVRRRLAELAKRRADSFKSRAAPEGGQG